MTVVSNTSLLNYLTLIGLEHLLPALFGRVIIPLAVQDELRVPGAPAQIRELLDRRPAWLEATKAPPVSDPILAGLDKGEREAIALAVNIRAELTLLDENRGRNAAERLGLNVAGTIGVLDGAARAGLIDTADAIKRLRKTTFRSSPRLYELLAARAAARQE